MPGRNNFSETMSKEKILILKFKLMINQKYHFDITPPYRKTTWRTTSFR